MEFRKKLKFRLLAACLYVIIGAVLIVVSAAGLSRNEQIMAFGIVFVIVGFVRCVRYFQVTKNEETIHAVEVAENDERNVMIMVKARSLTFSLFIMLAGIVMIVLYLLEQSFAAQIIAYTICAFSLLYYICYQIISRKY